MPQYHSFYESLSLKPDGQLSSFSSKELDVFFFLFFGLTRPLESSVVGPYFPSSGQICKFNDAGNVCVIRLLYRLHGDPAEHTGTQT